MIVYHITPKKNFQSIRNSGIEPRFCKTAWKRSWYCDLEKVTWAAAHVSRNHNVLFADIVIFVAGVPLAELKRSTLAGLYYTTALFQPFAWRELTRYESLEASMLKYGTSAP